LVPSLGQLDDQRGAAAAALEVSAAAADPRPLSARTLQFYANDWAAFVAWCRAAGAVPLPADATTVAAYLKAESGRLSPGALARRLAAIADQHQRQRLPSPHQGPAVRAVLKAARREAAPRRDPPPSPARLARMIAACPGDLAGLRDRALLGLMAAIELGRAALVGLDAEDILKTRAGCDVRFVEADRLNVFRLSRDPDQGKCPVHALEEWLSVSDTSFGPVFRKIDRWGNIEHHRLGTDAVRRILARRSPPRPRRRPLGGAAAERLNPG
jgi:site-specific recombinase XerC